MDREEVLNNRKEICEILRNEDERIEKEKSLENVDTSIKLLGFKLFNTNDSPIPYRLYYKVNTDYNKIEIIMASCIRGLWNWNQYTEAGIYFEDIKVLALNYLSEFLKLN